MSKGVIVSVLSYCVKTVIRGNEQKMDKVEITGHVQNLHFIAI